MILNNISEIINGDNGSISILIDDNEISYSVVDDFIVKSIGFKSRSVHLICESGLSPTGVVNFVFEGTSRVEFSPMDTYEAYNTHQEEPDLTVIDTIVYDPNRQEENTEIVVVGFGWVLKIDAESLTADYKLTAKGN